MSDDKTDNRVQGEGDYIAGRRFQEAETAFAKDGPVAEKAREAAEALKGPKAAELEAARKSTARGDIHGGDKGESPKIEK